jgi:hypothetical protein
MSTFRNDLFAGVSGLTSNLYLTADAAELTLQVGVASATSLAIQASNVTGFRETIAETDWSTLTTVSGIAANDLLNIEPGFRWLRLVRESATSLPSATLAGRNVVWGMG